MKKKSTSTTERTNVKYGMWRKQVDRSITENAFLRIVKWMALQWELEKHFPYVEGISNSKNEQSEIEITFNKEKYVGHLTRKSLHDGYRLRYSYELLNDLKRFFLMSHMRAIEYALQGSVGDIETEIPFWEFLDIEFNPNKKRFEFTAHYRQKPMFPELFKHLVGAPALKVIEDKIFEKSGFRIHKENWKPREELETEIGANNVIYTLLDEKNKLIYVGEAENLVQRLRAGHSLIPDWTHYRYDLLPRDIPKDVRVAIERMVIRSHASLFENKKDIKSFKIPGYRLVNRKIDS